MGAKIDRSAFERLVREHHAGAYRAALRVVREEALALDAVQQTFLSVLERGLAPETAADAGRLLRCAAARQAAMLLRSERARAHREAEVGMQRTERSEAGDAAQHEALRAELAALPDELRLAVVLRYQEDLTLAEIGEVLAISAPSVHGRLERALEKLRERMSRLGFAALLPQLPEMLAHDEPASVPPQALPRLLALTQGTLSLATLVPVASVLLLGVVGAAYLLPRGPERGAADEVELASRAQSPSAGSVREEAAGNRRFPVEEAAAASRGSVALAEARIEGQVRDELGFAVEGAEVRGSSLEREGKFSTFSRSTRSAADGTFALSLPVAVESGQEYSLAVRTESLAQEAGVVRLQSGQTAPYQRIQLFAPATDRAGAFELELSFRDPRGAPIAGAVARLHRTMRHAGGASWLQWVAGGRADQSGELRLSGEGLGTRVVIVDARDQGYAIARERIELAGGSATRRTVVLQKGLSIRGTILDERGLPLEAQRIGAPNSNALHALAQDRDEWLGASFPEPGRFEITALAAEPHELHFGSEHWSPFSLHAVRPGGEPLEIRLKLRSDPADVGLHDAEIHARLVDAASGEPVPVERAWTWIDRIGDDSPGLADGDFAPLLMEQVIVQTSSGPDLEERAPDPPAGALACVGLEGGRYVLRVRVEGYAPALLGPLELAPRAIASGELVRLARGSLVRGQVLDAGGRPLAGARVLALGTGALSRRRIADLDQELRSTAGRGTIHAPGVATDSAGRFELAHVPARAGLRLYVLHAGFEPAVGGALELAEGASAAEQLLRAGEPRER